MRRDHAPGTLYLLRALPLGLPFGRPPLMRAPYFPLILLKTVCYKIPLFNSHASIDPVVSLMQR
jgi:hypothetical protein